jgi:hypothetical protein
LAMRTFFILRVGTINHLARSATNTFEEPPVPRLK